MTVKQLIKKLEKCSQDAEVKFVYDGPDTYTALHVNYVLEPADFLVVLSDTDRY